MAATKERLDKHDKQIAAIRKLLKQGMRLLVELAASQKRTERKLEALIDSLRLGGNGHSKTRKLNLE